MVFNGNTLYIRWLIAFKPNKTTLQVCHRLFKTFSFVHLLSCFSSRQKEPFERFLTFSNNFSSHNVLIPCKFRSFIKKKTSKTFTFIIIELFSSSWQLWRFLTLLCLTYIICYVTVVYMINKKEYTYLAHFNDLNSSKLTSNQHTHAWRLWRTLL